MINKYLFVKRMLMEEVELIIINEIVDVKVLMKVIVVLFSLYCIIFILNRIRNFDINLFMVWKIFIFSGLK